MAIKILMERKVKKGMEREINKILIELRTKALNVEGYISGETLKSVADDSFYLVISSWQTLENWKHWETSPERLKIQQKIDGLLERPQKNSIFENM